MEKTILIASHVSIGRTVMNQLLTKDLIVVSPEEINQSEFVQCKPSIKITNTLPPDGGLDDSFVCKGKHRYTEELCKSGAGSSQWVCQCGRNMND